MQCILGVFTGNSSDQLIGSLNQRKVGNLTSKERGHHFIFIQPVLVTFCPCGCVDFLGGFCNMTVNKRVLLTHEPFWPFLILSLIVQKGIIACLRDTSAHVLRTLVVKLLQHLACLTAEIGSETEVGT